MLRILMDIFPTVADAMGNHLQKKPANRHAVNHNWKCIDACIAQLCVACLSLHSVSAFSVPAFSVSAFCLCLSLTHSRCVSR
eukprot:COSAG03_NODE_333_length_8929_cov_6.096149_11_plen_82_part_00